MIWFSNNKDVITAAIALLALVVSLVTVYLGGKQQQREAYREMYGTLMSDDLHRGRWMIYKIKSSSDIPPEDPDYRLVLRTLGVFDNLAMFVDKRVIPEKWALDVWHHPLQGMRKGAEVLREANRNSLQPGLPWPQLWTLFDKAETYRSNLACCTGGASPRRA